MNLLNEPIPPEVDRFVDYSMSISGSIIEVLRQNQWSVHDLAKRLKVPKSRVNEMLSGRHNFTLRTIAKIETELNIKLIVPTFNPGEQK